MRLAPNVYVSGSSLTPEATARHHLCAVIHHFWPGAVLTGRSAWGGPTGIDGWVFVSHPAPGRRKDLQLPGVTVAVTVGPGALPGDVRLPSGIFQAGRARGLVENLSRSGRPPIGRPSLMAGTAAVEDRMDDYARTGRPGTIDSILRELDVISGSYPEPLVTTTRTWLKALLGTLSDGKLPGSPALAA
jgi:hypothetical protein